MSNADCTPGREPRSVAASYSRKMQCGVMKLGFHCKCHFASDCMSTTVQKSEMAAESVSTGTVASPLQGFQTLVSNLHADVSLDDVLVSSAVYCLLISAVHVFLIQNIQLCAVILLHKNCSFQHHSRHHTISFFHFDRIVLLIKTVYWLLPYVDKISHFILDKIQQNIKC